MAGLLSGLVHCGYELASAAPFTQLAATWTVPNLNYTPTPQTPDGLVRFRTFFGLFPLDVHVEMTVDAAQNVTSVITIHTGAQVALPVRTRSSPSRPRERDCLPTALRPRWSTRQGDPHWRHQSDSTRTHFG